MADDWLDPDEYFRRLPVLGASAGHLVTDPRGRVLLVKPNYREGWSFPGGVVEHDEPPDRAAVRESLEEIGLDLPGDRLLVVSWLPSRGRNPRPMVRFIFDGGVLADPGRIVLQADELDDFAFLAPDEAHRRLHPQAAYVLPAALEARAAGAVRYLSHLGS